MVKILVMLLGGFALGVSLAAADLTGLWSLDLMPDFGGTNDSVGCSFLSSDAARCLRNRRRLGFARDIPRLTAAD